MLPFAIHAVGSVRPIRQTRPVPKPGSSLPSPLNGTIVMSWTHDARHRSRRSCQPSALTIQNQELIRDFAPDSGLRCAGPRSGAAFPSDQQAPYVECPLINKEQLTRGAQRTPGRRFGVDSDVVDPAPLTPGI